MSKTRIDEVLDRIDELTAENQKNGLTRNELNELAALRAEEKKLSGGNEYELPDRFPVKGKEWDSNVYDTGPKKKSVDQLPLSALGEEEIGRLSAADLESKIRSEYQTYEVPIQYRDALAAANAREGRQAAPTRAKIRTEVTPFQVEDKPPAQPAGAPEMTDDQIIATARAGGVSPDKTIPVEETRDNGVAIARAYDKEFAKARYGELATLINNGSPDEIRTEIMKIEAGPAKDFALNDFCATVLNFCGIADETRRKELLENTVKEYKFLEDTNLTPKQRLENNIAAQGNIRNGRPATAAAAASPYDDQHPARVSYPDPVGYIAPLSAEEQKKLDEELEKKRKEFVNKYKKENPISAKDTAINIGKAATCLGLCVALPGFGFILSGAFLYATKGYGNSHGAKKAEAKAEALQKELEAQRKGQPTRGSFSRNKSESEPHILEAARKVAADEVAELHASEDQLRAARASLEGVNAHQGQGADQQTPPSVTAGTPTEHSGHEGDAPPQTTPPATTPPVEVAGQGGEEAGDEGITDSDSRDYDLADEADEDHGVGPDDAQRMQKSVKAAKKIMAGDADAFVGGVVTAEKDKRFAGAGIQEMPNTPAQKQEGQTV